MLKEQMVKGAFNPEVMRDCSQVLVFAAWDSYSDTKIDKVYDHHTDVRDLPRGRFSSYTDQIKVLYNGQTPEEHFAHTARQTYIALGLSMAQAAELKIDSTPAEGFSNAVVDEILGLEKLGLKSVTLLYLGYRDDANDYLAHMKKVRIPMEEFIIIR
ncbi:nitroreductase family protein [Halpernia sp. GG3]